jgi:hypothetical protein
VVVVLVDEHDVDILLWSFCCDHGSMIEGRGRVITPSGMTGGEK